MLNNTTDGSQGVVAEAAASFPQLDTEVVTVAFPPQEAHAGSARSLAMTRAALRAPEEVILTTDADADGRLGRGQSPRDRRGGRHSGGRIFGDPQEEARLGPAFLRRARLHGR